MPWRYILFSILVLGSAFGASKLIVAMQGAPAGSKMQKSSPPATKQTVVEDAAPAQNISGRSIAPGGVGGRQSQFSTVLANSRS